jgi:hypothetical protein
MLQRYSYYCLHRLRSGFEDVPQCIATALLVEGSTYALQQIFLALSPKLEARSKSSDVTVLMQIFHEGASSWKAW